MRCEEGEPLKKKLDLIEQLIEVSDKCLTMHPAIRKNGKIKEFPCNCRKNVAKLMKSLLRGEYLKGVQDGVLVEQGLMRNPVR